MSDWCPENDGAYRAELAAKARAMGEHTIPSQDALIRAALERAGTAARMAMVGNTDADELTCSICAAVIRAMRDDPEALAAIKAKAGEGLG